MKHGSGVYKFGGVSACRWIMKFDEKVWQLTKRIPKGKVTTYKLVAKKLETRAYRAVGNALNRNPYAPGVPCHRVVKSDGTVGGFAKGTKKKVLMLRKEGIRIKNRRVADFKNILYRF